MQYRNKIIEFKVETDYIWSKILSRIGKRRFCDQFLTFNFFISLIFNRVDSEGI